VSENLQTRSFIDRLIGKPTELTSADIDEVLRLSESDETDADVDSSENIRSADLAEIFRRIYDLDSLEDLGLADKGLIGWLNRRSNRRRKRRAKRRIRRSSDQLKVVYAEGDSWFQHPIIPEILDHLSRMGRGRFVVHDSAMGGDWLLNYLHEGEYVKEISLYDPDAILLSGGGNDIVGEKKIAFFVKRDGLFKSQIKDLQSTGASAEAILERIPFLAGLLGTERGATYDPARLIRGFEFLTREFYSVILFFELCYKFLIRNIRKKFTDVVIVTQGYDYPIPSKRRAFPLIPPLRFAGNVFMDNGHWLLDALLLRGVTSDQDRRDIMYTIIYCFNEMLIRVGRHPQIGKRVYHVDARGSGPKEHHWFDEMHLSSRKFKSIADLYRQCLDDHVLGNVGESRKVFSRTNSVS
jgi:hypothetical protein